MIEKSKHYETGYSDGYTDGYTDGNDRAFVPENDLGLVEMDMAPNYMLKRRCGEMMLSIKKDLSEMIMEIEQDRVMHFVEWLRLKKKSINTLTRNDIESYWESDAYNDYNTGIYESDNETEYRVIHGVVYNEKKEEIGKLINGELKLKKKNVQSSNEKK